MDELNESGDVSCSMEGAGVSIMPIKDIVKYLTDHVEQCRHYPFCCRNDNRAWYCSTFFLQTPKAGENWCQGLKSAMPSNSWK